MPSAPPQRSNLHTRMLSAAALAPVALFAAYWGGLPFTLLVMAVAAISFWEWTDIASVRPATLRLGGVACLAASLLAVALGYAGWAAAGVLTGALLALALGVADPAWRWTGLGLLYAAAPCAAFILIRQSGATGWVAILFVLLVVWGTDIAAYFGGRALGGPKLWPRVSPSKTWSGAFCGLAAGAAAGGIFVDLMGAGSVLGGICVAAALSAASQAGDLLESAVKRRFGVKDSGRTIPGHGGVLDRIDGVFGAAALAWLIAAMGWADGLIGLPRHVAGLAGTAP